jgi:hypothetical protein
VTFITQPGEYSIAREERTYTSPGGVLIVPADSEVTINGFSHVRPDNAPSDPGTVQSGWGIWDLSLYVRGVDETSWIYWPGMTKTVDDEEVPDEVRFWDALIGEPHWCSPGTH